MSSSNTDPDVERIMQVDLVSQWWVRTISRGFVLQQGKVCVLNLMCRDVALGTLSSLHETDTDALELRI